jgi:hypothetical protein
MKTYFSGTQESSILAPETTPKSGALRAPPFGEVSGSPGAVQTPKIYDFWVSGEQVFMIMLMRGLG